MRASLGDNATIGFSIIQYEFCHSPCFHNFELQDRDYLKSLLIRKQNTFVLV